ncbi:hypothetical protein [Brevibacillus agri]|uniref:hypothetical protein n=1 Tax=Brevibacillus agri TaxID=51101 RepID=UPI0030F39334
MSEQALFDVAAQGGIRLAAVIAGTCAFNPADFVQYRQIIALLKRDRDADIALYGRKMDEVYACVQRLDALRRTMPEDSRPVRKVKAEIVRLIDVIDRARGRVVERSRR